jgi:hypothetical protein
MRKRREQRPNIGTRTATISVLLSLLAAVGCAHGGASMAQPELAPLPPDDPSTEPSVGQREHDDPSTERPLSDDLPADRVSADQARAVERLIELFSELADVVIEADGDCAVLATRVDEFADRRADELTDVARRLERLTGPAEADVARTLQARLGARLSAIQTAVLACRSDDAAMRAFGRFELL